MMGTTHAVQNLGKQEERKGVFAAQHAPNSSNTLTVVPMKRL